MCHQGETTLLSNNPGGQRLFSKTYCMLSESNNRRFRSLLSCLSLWRLSGTEHSVQVPLLIIHKHLRSHSVSWSCSPRFCHVVAGWKAYFSVSYKNKTKSLFNCINQSIPSGGYAGCRLALHTLTLTRNNAPKVNMWTEGYIFLKKQAETLILTWKDAQHEGSGTDWDNKQEMASSTGTGTDLKWCPTWQFGDRLG